MARYLVFELSEDDAKRSDFAAYTLGISDLLPRYFGDLAPINVFLGENNSGKSRFMREIMKRDPTRVFDFDSSVEILGTNIQNGLDSVPSKLPNNVFDIDVVLHQSALRHTETMDLFLLTVKQGLESSTFQLSPSDDSEAIITLLEQLRSTVAEPKLLLDMLTGDQVYEIVKQLQGHIFRIKQASSVYKTLGGRGFRELGLELRSISGVASFASAHAVLKFESGGQSTHFNGYDYRNNISDEVSSLLDCIIEYSEPVFESLSALIQQNSNTRNRTYIPTLRTARTLTHAAKGRMDDDVMESTIIADYDLKSSGVQVNTGLSLYASVHSRRNTDLLEREEFEKFEHFLSETFFNGKRVQVVPNLKTTSILVAVDREERALPYLGDGIQAIILLLYPLFIASKGAWFFIEEPETHLHPGFQRLFIKTIATHPVLLEKELTVFLTTHSNHLLDFAIDEAKNINLFTFRKLLVDSGEAKYHVQLTAPHDLECLAALGVQNSSVFLSNCTIWVEGITDRIYLKAYLAAYLKYRQQGHARQQTFSLLEGLHYSFLEYAGANVAHYTFGAKSQQVSITDEALQSIQALSISNRIMLIADQDAGKDAKHERLTSQQHAGFEYVMLPTREIENLLMPEVIVSALQKLYSKQTFNATLLKYEKYQNIYLASYLRGKFPELRDTFVGKSGTISGAKKRDFAEAAAASISSWEQLSPEAQKLTKQVFEFIQGHNPRLGSN